MANKDWNKSDEEWEKSLDPLTYQVTRKKATERPFTGAYNDLKEKGQFDCICCGLTLFDSNSKFDSGCGWPSFFKPIKDENVKENKDISQGLQRVEVVCPRCDSHLGHVFPDGPEPTGLRYCINSVSLKFKSKRDS